MRDYVLNANVGEELKLDQNNNELKLIATAYKSLVEHLQTINFESPVAISTKQNLNLKQINKKKAYDKEYTKYLGLIVKNSDEEKVVLRHYSSVFADHYHESHTRDDFTIALAERRLWGLHKSKKKFAMKQMPKDVREYL